MQNPYKMQQNQTAIVEDLITDICIQVVITAMCTAKWLEADSNKKLNLALAYIKQA